MNSSNHNGRPTFGTAPAKPAINPPRRIRTTKPDGARAVQPIPAKQRSQAENPQSRAVRVKLPRDKRDKRQPTGDYSVGYARPPAHTQFKANNPGGPGRPKGSRSQNSILRKELEAKRVVRIDGRTVKLSNRELGAKMFIAKAFEKSDPKLLLQVNQFSQQLFPEQTESSAATTDPSATANLDQQILSDFFTGLELGEPGGAGTSALACLGIRFAPSGPGSESEDWGTAADGGGVEDLADDEECGHED